MGLSERLLPRLVVVAPLVVVFLFTATVAYLYSDKTNEHFEKESKRFFEIYLEGEKRERIIWLRQYVQMLQFEYGKLPLTPAGDSEKSVEQLASSLLGISSQMPSDESGNVAIFKGGVPLLLRGNVERMLEAVAREGFLPDEPDIITWQTLTDQETLAAVILFEPFQWHIVYTLNVADIEETMQTYEQVLGAEYRHEMAIVIFSSLLAWVFFSLFSLLVSRKINALFARYRDEVASREASLKDFNLFLEERVGKEVKKHLEKEKMLIQQSKMAAMGDMLSMIAHQWRQPLNQLSYLFMNIEGAYENHELNKGYLDAKIAEGTALLEFMSHTVDDFRNFFRPDSQRVRVNIEEVINQALELIGKTLEIKGIELRLHHGTHCQLPVYRNELIQVLLNLIGNAKDVLSERKIEEPRILIATKEEAERIVIEICDNGGGVDEAVKEKIFEPYYTTKHAGRGTGLGLYMSKTIIEEHLGGTLALDNRSSGACFAVSLPKSPSEG